VVSYQEWRQYVSLAIVAGVLVDILLGSPLANALLKPLRDAQEQPPEDGDSEKSGKRGLSNTERSKERIDTEKFAQAAIDRYVYPPSLYGRVREAVSLSFLLTLFAHWFALLCSALSFFNRANNALELKKYLENRKTDWDRMEEMKRNLDKSMQDLDEDLETRQKLLDERKKN
jgi:hypothetical protein